MFRKEGQSNKLYLWKTMPKLFKCASRVALCGMFALTLSVWVRSYPTKNSVPALFLLGLVLVTYCSGRITGLLTALVGELIFATFLFPPYGSLAIAKAEDQVALVSFAVASLVVVRVSPIPQKDQPVVDRDG